MDLFLRQIPSVKWLVTFRLAAAHQSFTQAAAQLNVTQPAVSRQIRLLEESLGVRLFDRIGRNIRLTAEGERFRDAIEFGFGHIGHAVERMQQTQSVPHVTIQTDSEFASFWLLPVIKSFNRRHPRITASILTSYEVLDYRSQGVDLGVIFGDGNWPGVTCTRLFYEHVFPVCSPDYFDAHPFLTTIEGLNQATLLGWHRSYWNYMNWEEWFHRMGYSPSAGIQSLRVNDYQVVIQAAVNGLGVSLAWGYCLGDLLETGKLVRPLREEVVTHRGQFLAVPNELPVRTPTRQLHDWVLQEARRFGGPIAAQKDLRGESVDRYAS